ncbi:Glycosyltransferase involved in cell wall bisynthesis [Chitinophaga ginsengisegetis]|uniref:Glycosyltransferase involved in cell wall bisynthesis n=1 Tax=Chitinophaga ginsengisegetis TaxID=393003 RepID=A0A1T5PAL5_9BACT|nr:glycosyltransferase [Chitinophaga ginsengisegetis]SKD09657.1 Glycosyltransferase involved in cell wall bisynthesis [Chitinophaga ginsengisegetis]
MKQRSKLLILATTPPPIGGVTIHIQRLLQYLNNNGYEYTFTDFRRSTKGDILKQIRQHRFIHFHIYHPVVRCCFVLLGTIFGKRMLFTLHGNLGRHNALYNLLDQLAFRIAYMPIVLNQKSFEKGRKWNKRTQMIGAFIPPQQPEELTASIQAAVAGMRAKYAGIYATNASTVSIDKAGNETYQVTLLVNIFRKMKDDALVISDASGRYKSFLQQQGLEIPANVLLISEPHPFFEILKRSDVFLRITTTDGDSLSVKEALFLGKQVLATDVVNRPAGTQLVALNEWDIADAIGKMRHDNTVYNRHTLSNGGEELLQLYKKVVA